MLVSTHEKTLTLSLSLRAIVALSCVLLTVLVTSLFSSTGYVLARRKISDLRYLESLEDSVRNQIVDLQEECNALYNQLQDAWREVERMREILRTEGISDGEASQNDIVSTASSPSSVSRGGVSRRTSLSEMMRTMDALGKETDSLQALTSELEEAVSRVAADISSEVAFRRAIPSIYPVEADITSPFGWRMHPVTGIRSYHSGIDIGAPRGTVIRVTADGTVAATGWDEGYGLRVVVDHGYAVQTLYGHCSRILAKVGQKVKRGDAIAHVGNSGVSTGPHVHYEVRLRGDPVNPEQYLPK